MPHHNVGFRAMNLYCDDDVSEGTQELLWAALDSLNALHNVQVIEDIQRHAHINRTHAHKSTTPQAHKTHHIQYENW